ncbi:HEAT repeat domain-containing protein [Thermoleptolyngbya sichuanensis XZ-Cy5]|uniref:HEAT repeat domain-containing protein n=1 Tax=Thermoleptolyngbya sichuanensis TaxID=2885951 RepID=UPI00240D0B38|nr:HEAT repeat domain-containing protein [Thermoleptolyngbya sichuanensis]MDG2615120.1 HEAT repeat domain-containing protein [Thermoleptolyngbya sichuanensis XZ-Cy5]
MTAFFYLAAQTSMVSNPRILSAQSQDFPLLPQAEDGAIPAGSASQIAADWELLVQRVQQHLGHLEEQLQTSGIRPARTELETLSQWAIAVLCEGDFQDRWDVAKLFPRLEALAAEPAESVKQLLLDPLLALLQDEEEDQDTRWFVARILGEFRQPAVLTALVHLLQTAPTEDLQQIAAAALAGFGKAAIAPLAQLLRVPHTRLLAVKTLSQIQDPGVVQPLMKLLRDPDPQVRAAALSAIGSARDRHIPDLLIAALGDSSAAVRQVAVMELGFRADLLSDYDLVSLIYPLLLDASAGVAQQAAIALGRLGTNPAATALYRVAHLPHTTHPQRMALVQALGWMGTPTALHHLHRLALQWSEEAPSAPLLHATIQAMGRVEVPELRWQAARYLVELLHGNLPAVQTAAVKQAIALQLGKLGDLDVLDALVHLATDPDLGVKLHAIAALKQLHPDQGRQQLEALSNNHQVSEQTRQEVAIALAEW